MRRFKKVYEDKDIEIRERKEGNKPRKDKQEKALRRTINRRENDRKLESKRKKIWRLLQKKKFEQEKRRGRKENRGEKKRRKSKEIQN